VPIPWDPDQVAYVWADALVNYLSALSYAPGEDLQRFWPATHLLAKDILRFHCVYWPALLLAAGYEPPRQLFVHGYLNIDQQKISKSLGNVIDPLDLIDVYGADAVRFWCARQVSFGQDGNVTFESFQERYDRELANDLGNLLSRTTAMIARYREGVLAQTPGSGAVDPDVLRAALVERFDRFDITGALEDIWQAVRRLNQYVEANAPWELAKDDSKAEALDAVLYDLADGLAAVAVAVSPYLPETAPRILEALGQAGDLSLDRVRLQTAEAAEGIEPAAPLFPRVEEPTPA
jgi:methionyl-tRNA synthetase